MMRSCSFSGFDFTSAATSASSKGYIEKRRKISNDAIKNKRAQHIIEHKNND
jgi:hypothetical protein